jgi:hypothetical protein
MNTKRAGELVVDINRKKLGVLSTVVCVGKFFKGVRAFRSADRLDSEVGKWLAFPRWFPRRHSIRGEKVSK